MTGLYQKFSIAQRVSILLVLSLLMMAGGGVSAIFKINMIGHKFETVTKIYQPVISSLQLVNEYQLKQVILFKKSLLVTLLESGDAAAVLEETEKSFNRLSISVSDEIEQIEKSIQRK